jgi:PAS domain S-box-containing protein
LTQRIDCRDALLTLREPVLVLNNQLEVQIANHPFLEAFQVSAEETLTRRIFDVGNGQWNFPEIHRMLHRLRNPGERSGEVVIEHDFERIGNKAFRINFCRFNEKTYNLILLAINEISPAQTYRRVFDTASDGLLIVDAESARIIDANQCMTSFLGSDREQLIGRLFWEVEPLNGTPLGQEGFDRVRAQGLVRFPVVGFQSFGRFIEAEVVGNVVNSQFVLFNLRDVTERRRYDQQSRLAAKHDSLGVLAGGIAHDFNNLLAVILGYATLAMGDAPDENRYRDSLNRVIDAGQRAAELTRQMITYSGNDHRLLRRVDISKIVRESGLSLKDSIPPLVSLNLGLATEPVFVNADTFQIKQLVRNMLINGAEAVGKGEVGHVIVTTGQEFVDQEYIRLNVPANATEMSTGPYAFIEIWDSGSGLDAETKAKIFDPFFSTKFVGRGLGLAAALGIVKGHGGSIVVKSGVYGGTTFKVFLPLHEASQLPTVAASAAD